MKILGVRERRTLLQYIGSIALLFALVLGIVGTNPLRQTLAPMDLLLAYPGWDNVGIDTPLINPERSDALDHRLPNWREFRRQLRDGHIPLWNPLHQLGAPGIQSPIYEGLSVPFLIFAITPSEAMGYTLALISNYAIAATGTYFLLLFMFANRWAALFGALVFAFCGFNIAWAHWPHLTTSALIPWVLVSQLRYWQTGRFIWALGFTFSVALMALGGFPFVAILGAISSLLLGIILIIRDARRKTTSVLLKRAIGLGLSGIAGACLALPGLLQVNDILRTTDLSHRSGGTIFNYKDIYDIFGGDFLNNRGVERTFSAGFFSALLGIISVFLFFIRFNYYALFGFIVFIFTFMTSFGVISDNIVRLIPSFSFNSWSRSVILIGLSLSVLSAYSINILMELSSRFRSLRKFTYVFFIFAFIFNSGQLFYNFHISNAKPTSNTYFPLTPSISYIKNQIKPLQSVLVDESFIISGVASNYGVPELFAHGFRTAPQDVLIDKIALDHAATPTASIVKCDSINLASKALTYAAIRFMLLNESCADDTVYQTQGSGNHPTPSLNSGALEGKISVNKALRISKAAVLFATYKEEHAPSAVLFEIYKGADLIVRTELRPEEIQDNRYATFNFGREVPMAAGDYRYVVSLADPSSLKKLSVWAFERADEEIYQIGGKPFLGAPKIKLLESKRTPLNITKESVESGIIIFTNKSVFGSGYFVDSLDGEPDVHYENVRLAAHQSDNIEMEYIGEAPGWIVLPIRIDSNWKATLNGAPAKIEKFLNLFPAVKVNGKSKIRLYYDISDTLNRIYTYYSLFIIIMISLVIINYRWKVND